jgi:hypothetical protein
MLKLKLTLRAVAVTMIMTMTACKARKPEESSSSAVYALPEQEVKALFQLLTPENIRKEVVNQYERLRISTKAKIFTLDSADLASLTGAYRYAVRPIGDRQHQRQDAWQITGEILPGTVLMSQAGDQLPFMLRLKSGRTVTFTRQFPSKGEAAIAVPRTPVDTPLTWRKALALTPGEVVSIPLDMGITAGLAYNATPLPLGAGASVGVFWSGEFRIEVSRLNGSWVRVRISPVERAGTFFNGFVGYKLDYFGYGPFGLANLDRIATRELGLDFLRINGERSAYGRSVSFDYAYQLNNQDSADAYTALMSKTLMLNPRLSAQAVASISGGAALRSKVFLSFDYSEQLAREDVRRALSQQRVRRIATGDRDFEETVAKAHFGTKLLRFSGGKSLSVNKFRIDDGAGPEQYFLSQYAQDNQQSSLFSPLKESDSISATSMFTADETWRNHKFVDFLFTWTRHDRLQLAQEQSDYRGSLAAIFGDNHPLPRSFAPREPLEKFSSTLHMVFRADLFGSMWRLAKKDAAAYEDLLIQAAEGVSERFDRRFGIGTPGRAVSIRDQFNSWFKLGWQQVRHSFRSALSARWGSAAAQATYAIVETSTRLGIDPETDVFAAYTALLRDHPAATELMPAYFLELARLLRATPYVDFQAVGSGREVGYYRDGSNPNEAMQERIQDAFDYLRVAGQ